MKCTCTKLRKNGNWTYEDLNAAILVVDDGALIKIMTWLYGIPTTSLRDYVIKKTIGRKRGRLEVLSYEEKNERVNWRLSKWKH